MTGEKANFQIPARGAAISSICLNIVFVTVIAVILYTKEIDFLSTLALALAVIAFLVQIIVFIQQASASTTQLARAEELHGSTMRALAAIEEKTEGTRQTVTTISEHMLTAMLSKGFSPRESAAASESGSGVSMSFQSDEGTMTSQTLESRPSAMSRSSERSRFERALAAHEWPLPFGKRLEEAVEVMVELNSLDLINMEWLARDYAMFGSVTAPGLGHGVDGRSLPRKIYDLGLAKRIRAEWDPKKIVTVLTDKGKDVAALLFREEVPEDIDATVRTVRKRWADDEAAREQRDRARRNEVDDVPVEG